MNPAKCMHEWTAAVPASWTRCWSKASLAFLLTAITMTAAPAAFCEPIRVLNSTEPDKNAQEYRTQLETNCPGVDTTDNAKLLECLNKGIEQDPSNFALLHTRARVNFDLGNFDSALKDLAVLIEKDSNLENQLAYYLDRAQTNLKLKKYDDALQDCVEAQVLNRGRGNAWATYLLQAMIYKDMQQADKSVAAAQDGMYSLLIQGYQRGMYLAELELLSNGKKDYIKVRDTGMANYLRALRQLAELKQAPTNQQLRDILGITTLPDSERYTTFNTDFNSVWTFVYRDDNKIELHLDTNVCTIYPEDLKKEFKSWSFKRLTNSRCRMKAPKAALEFTCDNSLGYDLPAFEIYLNYE